MKGIYENDSKLEAVIHEKLSHYPPIMTQYFNWLMGTGKTINTVYVYIKALTHYIDCEFANVVPHDFYKQIDESSITRFLNSLDASCVLKENEPSNSNKAVKWTALNSFFQYLTPTYTNENPVEHIARPTVGKVKKSEYLTVNEVTALLNKAQQLNRGKICNRDLSIMMLGFYCGLRVSAIVQANIRDINWARKELRVYESNDEYYDVPLSTSVIEQLHIWLIDRKQILGTVESDALFVSLQGNRINEDTISLLLKTYSVEIGKNLNARMMRDTCIVNLYLKTRDLALCAKLLNQTNIASVYRYIEKLIPMSSVQNAVQVLDNLYGFKPGSSNGSK